MTPDSFSDGGRYLDPDAAWRRAEAMVSEGADIIDVGGESTRPGASPVDVDEECRRVLPVIEWLAKRLAVRLSVDTRHFEVARRAVHCGATLINDVSAAADARMVELLRDRSRGIVLMHMQGEPGTMQTAPSYPNGVVREVAAFLRQRTESLLEAGALRSQIWVDPGIGFGKTVAHNLALLGQLREISGIADRLLVGTSRKAFLSSVLSPSDGSFSEREPGTLASNLWAYAQGASVFRVHEVGAFRRALQTWEAMANAGQ